MKNKGTIGLIQATCGEDREADVEAVVRGAQITCLQRAI